jgi:hypothetical protein
VVDARLAGQVVHLASFGVHVGVIEKRRHFRITAGQKIPRSVMSTHRLDHPRNPFALLSAHHDPIEAWPRFFFTRVVGAAIPLPCATHLARVGALAAAVSNADTPPGHGQVFIK